MYKSKSGSTVDLKNSRKIILPLNNSEKRISAAVRRSTDIHSISNPWVKEVLKRKNQKHQEFSKTRSSGWINLKINKTTGSSPFHRTIISPTSLSTYKIPQIPNFPQNLKSITSFPTHNRASSDQHLQLPLKIHYTSKFTKQESLLQKKLQIQHNIKTKKPTPKPLLAGLNLDTTSTMKRSKNFLAHNYNYSKYKKALTQRKLKVTGLGKIEEAKSRKRSKPKAKNMIPTLQAIQNSIKRTETVTNKNKDIDKLLEGFKKDVLIKDIRSQIQQKKQHHDSSFSDTISDDQEYIINYPENNGNASHSEIFSDIMNSLERFAITESKIGGVGRKFKSVDKRKLRKDKHKLKLPEFKHGHMKSLGQDLYEILDDHSKYKEEAERFESEMHSRIEEDEKKNEERINEERAKQYKRKKALLVNAIIEAASNLKRMKVTPKEIMDGIIFPFEAYSRPGSRMMIRAVKEGNLEMMKKLVAKDRYLMYIHCNVKQTPLHWAAKRNHPEILEYLLQKGAFVNICDIGKRTPLFLAAKYGHVKCVKILLAYNANPTMKTFRNMTPYNVSQSFRIKSYIQKAHQLKILLNFIPTKSRAKVWQEQGVKILNELVNESEDDKL
ncbi:unnamed protein product [Moneuplotes crassus]|uniref:Uncharacterized protein n=1 Tax=Euplotes crassus TaxID=5936 RepID=A0AAD2DA12_EUPCR|nr:unnamed protein product [Moneuplotes crassus]